MIADACFYALESCASLYSKTSEPQVEWTVNCSDWQALPGSRVLTQDLRIPDARSLSSV
jgi:hypothetical protein